MRGSGKHPKYSNIVSGGTSLISNLPKSYRSWRRMMENSRMGSIPYFGWITPDRPSQAHLDAIALGHGESVPALVVSAGTKTQGMNVDRHGRCPAPPTTVILYPEPGAPATGLCGTTRNVILYPEPCA